MRILIISQTGNLLGLAQHLETEGHLVKMRITERDMQRVGEGVLNPVSDHSATRYDFIIMDIFGDISTERPTLGSSIFGRRMQDDPRYGAVVLRLCGVPLPLKKSVQGHIVSIGAFWDGISMEVPCIIWADTGRNYIERLDADAKILKQTLYKLEHFLKKSDYRGFIRIRAVIDSDDIYGLSLHAANDIEFLQTLLELKKSNIGGLLYSVALGRTDVGDWHNGIAAGVRVSMSGYYDEMPITGINEHNLKHIWLQSVEKRNGDYTCVQSDNSLLYITAGSNRLSQTPEIRNTSCMERIRRTLSNLTITGAECNTDAPDYIFNKIHEWL